MRTVAAVIVLLGVVGQVHAGIDITTAEYEGAEHFVVRTPAATYWYDKAGGGFSRLIDRDGNDWIGFRREPWNRYPDSAASAYRGLPNFVFGSEEGGAGHPGFTRCASVQAGTDSIVTTSRGSAWRWTWRFFDDHARVTMERAGPGGYWFLYEGTPGGGYAPRHWYWGHDGEGPLRTLPDFVKGEREVGRFRWAYFGDNRHERVFFIARHEPDESSDVFGVMGSTKAGLDSPDGMTVFGFGRAHSAKPLLTAAGRSFTIGFIEQRAADAAGHAGVKARIERLLKGSPAGH